MKKRHSLIVIFLLISLCIYLFYRTEKTIINELFIALFSLETYVGFKTFFNNTFPIHKQLVYSLPGGLWLFCVTVLSSDFYIEIRQRKLALFIIPFVFALGLELLQLLHITNGRFDFWDVASYLLFGMLAFTFFSKETPKQNIVRPFTLNSFSCMICFLIVYLADLWK